MPSKNDIINAVNNLDTFLKVKELEDAVIKKNINGQPYFFTGGFTMVFQLEKQSKKWAFRVWHTNISDLKDRFKIIARYLAKLKLPYFAHFIYDAKGLLVNGEFVDTIRMEWLEGLLLKDYIEQNLNDKQKLLYLAESFFNMCALLHEHKISHGDLQHGNIIIDTNDKIRLIDYDSICVPDIEGQDEFVSGLKGYQHLSRISSNNSTSLKSDYFSELIIYLSILAIAEKPELWDEYQVKNSEVLLFSEEDFENFKQSKIYNELSIGLSDNVKILLNILTDYLGKNSYLELEPIISYLKPPEIIQFSGDRDVIISGQKVNLSWNVENAISVELDNGIGKVNLNGNITFCPSKNAIVKLFARGYSEVVEKEIYIQILPLPIIEKLIVSTPNILIENTLKINIPDYQTVSNKYPNTVKFKEFDFSFKLDSKTFIPTPKHVKLKYKVNRVSIIEKIQRIFESLKNEFITNKNQKYVSKK
jgi:serine/threonine protein kinase